MGLFDWLRRKSNTLESVRLMDQGVWGDTPETLRHLADCLAQATYIHCNRRTLRRHLMERKTSNIEDLLSFVTQYQDAIDEDQYVPDPPPDIWRDNDLSMDDYLRGRHGGYLSIQICSQSLRELVLSFTDAILLAQSRESVRLNYYKRNSEPLIRELVDLAKHLVALSDQSR